MFYPHWLFWRFGPGFRRISGASPSPDPGVPEFVSKQSWMQFVQQISALNLGIVETGSKLLKANATTRELIGKQDARNQPRRSFDWGGDPGDNQESTKYFGGIQ